MIIKCDYCGYEEAIEENLEEETLELITLSRKVYCYLGECKGKKLRIPNGYVNRWGNIGQWNFQTEATLEEYRTLKRLKELVNDLYHKIDREA